MPLDLQERGRGLKEAAGFLKDLDEEVRKLLVGQRNMLDRLLIGLLAG